MSVSLLLVAFAAIHPHESLPPVEPARPRAALASYVSDADYPASALHARQEGTVAFVLGVGPDGRVGSCTISASSGSAALDNATCSLMRRRARFTPARDGNGNPVSDVVASSLAWSMPDPPPPAAAIGEPGPARLLVTVSPAGQVTGCRVVESSGSPALDQRSCRIVRERRGSEAADGGS